MRDLANQRRRFGYRRLFIVLRREGERSGVNRIYRLYREEWLSVRNRKTRRRAVGTRAPILVEAKANARWSLDFVHDLFALAIVVMGVGHIWMAWNDPEARSGLRTGFVSPGWAAQKHPLWDELASTGRGSGEEVTREVSEHHQKDR